MNKNHFCGIMLACCLIAIGGIVGSVAVGPAAAQEEDVPSIPGVYYGDISTTDGSVGEPVLIEAVADGEVVDTIVADADGSFGGPTVGDEKLEVQEPDSGEVEFHVGGTPVQITTLEDTTIDSTTMPWDSGTQEVLLEAEPDVLEPEFTVAVTDAPETVEAGSEMTVDAAVENIGPVEGTAEVELLDEDETVVDTATPTVGIEETADTSLTWTPEETADGNETLTVQVGNSTDTVTVEVEALRTPEIAPDPGDGDDNGGQAPAPVSPPDETDETETEVDEDGSITETQPIFNSEDFGLSQVRFSENTHVVAITWDRDDINGTVETTAFDEPPNETTPVPGGIGVVSEVIVADGLADESAIVEQRVATEQVDQIGADATELQGFRFTESGWEQVPTQVGDQTDDEIIVETDVPGFSYLAVSAVGTPEAVIETETGSLSVGDELQLSASESSDPYGEIVSYEWTVNGESLSGETVETTIEDEGEVEIELTVENAAGNTDTATQTITAEDTVPGFTVGIAVVALLVVIGSLLVRTRSTPSRE